MFFTQTSVVAFVRASDHVTWLSRVLRLGEKKLFKYFGEKYFCKNILAACKSRNRTHKTSNGKPLKSKCQMLKHELNLNLTFSFCGAFGV